MTASRRVGVAQNWRARIACRSGCLALPVALLLAALMTTGTTRAESSRVAFAGPPGHQTLTIDGKPAKYDPEADRLIARDAVAVDMARGITARAAVEAWAMRHRQSIKRVCKL